jgi:hypothetical protein
MVSNTNTSRLTELRRAVKNLEKLRTANLKKSKISPDYYIIFTKPAVENLVSKIPERRIQNYWINIIKHTKKKNWNNFLQKHLHIYTTSKSSLDKFIRHNEKYWIDWLRERYTDNLMSKKIFRTFRYLPDDYKQKIKSISGERYEAYYCAQVKHGISSLLKNKIYYPDTNLIMWSSCQSEVDNILKSELKRNEIFNRFLIPIVDKIEKFDNEQRLLKQFDRLLSRGMSNYLYFCSKPDDKVFTVDEIYKLFDLRKKSDIAVTKYIWKKLLAIEDNRFEPLLKEFGLINANGELIYPFEKNTVANTEQQSKTNRFEKGRLKDIICDFVLRDGCELYGTVNSKRIRRWIIEIKNNDNKDVKPGSIRTILSRLGYSEESRNYN